MGVSGDPGVVNSMADHYESVAASIRGAATRLRSLDAGSSSSDALDAFLAKAQQVSASLGKAEGRYGETGSALKTYASELSLAQEAAAPALANHRDAVDDLAAAERLVERYEQLALVATDEVTKQEHLDQAVAQRAKADDAGGRVALYARRLADAHASVETAATVAIARIDDATDDGLDDTVWDDLGGAWDAGFAAFQTWMEENDSWISGFMDVLTILGELLAALAFIVPGLNVVAAIIAVLAFAITAARASAGTATLGDVLLAGLSMATMGIGGAAVASARAGMRGIASARAAGLVTHGGVSRGSAAAWVSKSWSRAQPGLGDWTLVKALGDSDVARMLHFLRSSRPGAFADDAEEVATIMRKLNIARGIQAIDHALTTRDVFDVLLPRGIHDAPSAAAWRTSDGGTL
ncbi:putative T7SS-secreted protein [Frigoribacterium sp. VKM Ac-1396]|uniref:putative T7SS-secreted protein n=1 Tax=Frigoribacterium sp. VKM Ac-1396 TaxID=2783821 RepID=UPI00351BF492